MSDPITLVTTELEETWPVDGKVLFLGEWCRLHARRDHWKEIVGDVLPYHWNDRVKLRRDFDYLQSLNDDLLLELVPVMNELHQTMHDLRYWRLLLGFWLNNYTAVLFDRWASVELAAKTGLKLRTIVISMREELLAANDTVHFVHQATENPYWNNALFGLLLTRKHAFDIRNILPAQDSEDSHPTEGKGHVGRSLKTVARRLATLALYLKRNDRIVMMGTFLPRAAEWTLDVKFGQIPSVFLSTPSTPSVAFDDAERKWRMPSMLQSDEFGSLARELIPQFIPKVFVEGFKGVQQVVDALHWPASPRVIWTSNYHFSSDVFNLWAAQKCANGARLVIGEHGGLGSGAFNGAHSYEVAIADRYLSTGWADTSQPKITPIGNFRQVTRHQSCRRHGPALLVCGIMPRYGYDIRSMMLSSQVLDYFEEQFKFVDSLPQHIRQALLIRLYPADYKWDQRARWKERHPNITLDSGRQSIWKVAARSRLIISTYNATTHVEFLSLNFPTLMYWNPERWELKSEALPVFNDLRRAGVLHESPESAAKHLALIWDDVTTWWQSMDVQGARSRFCETYAANSPDLLSRIEAVLLEEAKLSAVTV